MLPTTSLAPTATIHIGDALTTLTHMPDHSVDAVVTDPPYAIKRIQAKTFMRPAETQPDCTTSTCGNASVCSTCERATTIAKFEQAEMLGQQSQNWHAKETHSRGYADNDPRQFQAWCSLWLTECLRVLKPGGHLVAFGGTRTWHRLAVAVEDAGFDVRDSLAWIYSSGMPKSLNVQRALKNAPRGIDPGRWDGWGTGLKPAFEPIVLARRPLDGTMAANIAEWGVGPLNLAPTEAPSRRPAIGHGKSAIATSEGKWPTNVHLDGTQATAVSAERNQDAAHYFWVSKPGRSERVVIDGVSHPTVKPLDLMRRLVRLVTPPGGVVLDPFAGSGTTIEACLEEGMDVIGIERDPAFEPLIEHRIARATAVQSATATAHVTDVQGREQDGWSLF